MLTLNQIISQITTLAGAHSQIASSGVGDFAEWQAEERTYPILWVFHEDSVIQDRYITHNIRLICADLVITGEEGEDTDGHEQEVLSDTQMVLLDFLAYFNNQYSQTYDIIRTATIDPFTERFNDRVAGNSVVLQIRQRFDWNKCSIPQSGASIPPTVDGLTLYDFSDPTVFARLTAQQVSDLEAEICGSPAPVTVSVNGVNVANVPSGDSYNVDVEDEAGNAVGTGANPSVVSNSTITINGSSLGATGSLLAEANLDIDVVQSGLPVGSWNGTQWDVPVTPCADATAQLNGVTMATIASGETENIKVYQETGTQQVGSQSGSFWRIADSDISINSTLIASVGAEDPLNIDVTQSGSPVGSWNGSAWIIPPATPFSVSASIDDNTPNFGQSVTLTATGTGLTGVTWYADGNQIGTGTPLVWSVNQSGTYDILAVATNGSEYAEDTISVTATLNQLISTDANKHRWWDFSQTGTLTGDPVQTIADALASGDNLTQASVALRPSRATVNGLTCAAFDRTVGDYLEKTGGSVTNYAETTMIFAFKPTEIYTNTTDRLFFVRKNGQNDFNGANSIAITNLLMQCLGGTKRSNFGTGLHIKVIRLSVAGAYLKERLYSNHDYIDSQVTLTASQLGLIFEIMRWGGQVSECGFEWQIFTRILTDGECDTEANKLRWKWGNELT